MIQQVVVTNQSTKYHGQYDCTFQWTQHVTVTTWCEEYFPLFFYLRATLLLFFSASVASVQVHSDCLSYPRERESWRVTSCEQETIEDSKCLYFLRVRTDRSDHSHWWRTLQVMSLSFTFFFLWEPFGFWSLSLSPSFSIFHSLLSSLVIVLRLVTLVKFTFTSLRRELKSSQWCDRVTRPVDWRNLLS